MMSDFSPSMPTRCVLSDRKPFIHVLVFLWFHIGQACGLGGCGLLCQRPLRSPWWGSLFVVHCQDSVWHRRWTPLVESRMTISFWIRAAFCRGCCVCLYGSLSGYSGHPPFDVRVQAIVSGVGEVRCTTMGYRLCQGSHYWWPFVVRILPELDVNIGGR